jgi:hypothetical protein
MCVSQLFFHINLIQLPRFWWGSPRSRIFFWKSFNFIFFFFLSIMVMILFHQNFCFIIFDKHEIKDLFKTLKFPTYSFIGNLRVFNKSLISSLSKIVKQKFWWKRIITIMLRKKKNIKLKDFQKKIPASWTP